MPITRSELSPGQQGTVRAEGPREGMEGAGGKAGGEDGPRAGPT